MSQTARYLVLTASAIFLFTFHRVLIALLGTSTQTWTSQMLTSREQILIPQPANIPQELKDALRWTNWRAESSKKKPGTLDKVPYCSKNTRRKASHSDPATWADYTAAHDAYRLNGEPPLDGFFFACGNDFGGIDIDDCVDPQTGEIAPFAMDVIREINSYSEKSVSGTGIRIFVRMPESKGTKHHPFEIYSTKRFLSVTGHHVAGTPTTVETRGEEVEVLRHRVLDMRAEAAVADRKSSSRRPSTRHPLDQQINADFPNVTALGISDDQIIKTCRGFKGFTALWEGDWSGYESHSNADMALAGLLAFACGPGEHERVERLMRRSGLVRDKWDRHDYLPLLTIPNAYADRTDFYKWPARDPDVPPPTCDSRPTIVMGPETDALLRQLETHLSPHLFQRYGRLVSVSAIKAVVASDSIRRPAGTIVVSDVPQEQVHRLMSRHVLFEQRKTVLKKGAPQVVAKQVPAPANLAKLFANCGQWPVIPNLVGITTTPFMRADGVVIDKPGYDPASGYLFVADGTTWLPTPARPTPGQIQDAIDTLLDIVCDFPFGTDEHRSAWLATLLAATTRPAIHGPVPMLWIDSPRAGTGKTKLARLIGHIINGGEPTEISFTSDETELENRLASLLLEGDRFAYFDNATGSLRNPVLDRFLTSTFFGVRRYYTQQIIKPRNTATLAVTGNNLVLRGDLSRRVLRARLVTDLERPETRSGFRHPDIEGYVADHRPQIINAVLTILRGHAVSGFPFHPRVTPLGSFAEWERIVRHALLNAGLADPVATQEEVHDEDDDQAKLLAFMESWHGFRSHLAGTATHIIAAAMEGGDYHCPLEQSDFREALRELTGAPVDRPPCPKALGYRLRDARDKKIAGFRIVKCDAKERSGVRWRLECDHSDDDDDCDLQRIQPEVLSGQVESIAAKAYGRPSLLRRNPLTEPEDNHGET